MTKNTLFTTLIFITASIMSVNTSAMNLNISLAPEINHKMSLAYDIYDTQGGINRHGDEHMAADFSVDKLQIIMKALNTSLANMTPTDGLQGEKSVVSLGYIKQDGTSISPATCKNIPARMQMNIYMDENGCTSK